MLMSDLIAKRIMELLENSEEGTAEIRRNTLAETIGCVPSQINYVISSRFTPERGYIVESKRGGGGYIRITEVRTGASNALMHIINSIGTSIDTRTEKIITENLAYREYLSDESAKLINAATSDNALRSVPPERRDELRASIFKQMLMTQI